MVDVTDELAYGTGNSLQRKNKLSNNKLNGNTRMMVKSNERASVGVMAAILSLAGGR